MSTIIDQFSQFYQTLSVEKIDRMSELYNENALFQDPLHQAKGLPSIQQYFRRTMMNVSECRFSIDEVVSEQGRAFINWKMTFNHPKLNKGRETDVPGASLIKFNQRIIYHRDYFDLGCMIYEHIPVLGKVIKKVKHRIIR